MQLEGWGRYPRIEGSLSAPRDAEALAALVARGPLIARGMGRAYGDAAIGRHAVSTRHFNRMIAFDDQTGQLTAESGVTLGEIIDAFLPRGWFLSVTPGTQFVSLGGAIAADVHGKNHHSEGSFGTFVDWIEVMGPDGRVTRTLPGEDLFEWTLGGMGLTGVIVRCAIRLKRVESGWIRQQTIAAPNLDAALAAFERTYAATYSMAWIDCAASGATMGRSIVMNGEHASRTELPAAHRGTPFVTPRHKGPRVREMIEAAGASLLFLPPYSPDFNPIENAFAKLKALLRKAAERTIDGLWNAIGETIDLFTPRECGNFFAAAGYDAT